MRRKNMRYAIFPTQNYTDRKLLNMETAYFSKDLLRIIISTRHKMIIPKMNDRIALLVKPATRNVKNETVATVIAYGIWVVTWFRWIHWAPADDIIVVSEIGEQWSPQTAPAIQAEMEIIIS